MLWPAVYSIISLPDSFDDVSCYFACCQMWLWADVLLLLSRQLEQRHADQLRMANEVAQAERDQLVSKLQRELDKRHQQLVQAKEEEVRLKESVQLTNEVPKILLKCTN